MPEMVSVLPKGFSQEAYGLHCSYWGMRHYDRLMQQVMEESGELLTAMSHRKRGRPGGDRQHLLAEIADLVLCLSYLNLSLEFTWNDVLRSARAKEVKMVAALYREVQRSKAESGGAVCPTCSSPICERVHLETGDLGWRCQMCGLIHGISKPTYGGERPTA